MNTWPLVACTTDIAPTATAAPAASATKEQGYFPPTYKEFTASKRCELMQQLPWQLQQAVNDIEKTVVVNDTASRMVENWQNTQKDMILTFTDT